MRQIAVVALALSFGVAQATDYRISPFQPSQSNIGTPWCWADTVSMVLHSRGIKKESCEIVSKLDIVVAKAGKNGPDPRACCKVFAPSACTRMGAKPHLVLKHFGVSYRVESVAPAQGMKAPMRAVGNIVRAVRDNKMPILHLSNTAKGDPDHVVVVYGVKNVERVDALIFEVYDPATGAHQVPALSFMNHYYAPTLPGAITGRYWWSKTYLAN